MSRFIGLLIGSLICLNTYVAVSTEEPENKRARDEFEKSRKFSESRRPPKEPYIPELIHIGRARADVYQNVVGKKDIDAFVIPPDKVAKLLLFFQEAEVDPAPFGDTYEIGTIRIDLNRGVVVRYAWYWYAPREHFSFSYNGIRYKSKKQFDGKETAWELDELIRDLHANVNK